MNCQTPEEAVSEERTGCSVLMSDVKPSTMRPPATGFSPAGAGDRGDGPHAAPTSIVIAKRATGRLIEPSTLVGPKPAADTSLYVRCGKTVRSARSLAADGEPRAGTPFSVVFAGASTGHRAGHARGRRDRRHVRRPRAAHPAPLRGSRARRPARRPALDRALWGVGDHGADHERSRRPLRAEAPGRRRARSLGRGQRALRTRARLRRPAAGES